MRDTLTSNARNFKTGIHNCDARMAFDASGAHALTSNARNLKTGTHNSGARTTLCKWYGQ